MDILPDEEAAKAILKDAEAQDAALVEILQQAYQEWRDTTAEMKKALAVPPPAQGF